MACCYFVCLFWKVGCVSAGIVTVFVSFPSVLSVIRCMFILFHQLIRGSVKRINQYPLLILHPAASYLKPYPCYFFLILSSRNWPWTMTHPAVKCSLCCCFVVSLRHNALLFSFCFLSFLQCSELSTFLMKHGRTWTFCPVFRSPINLFCPLLPVKLCSVSLLFLNILWYLCSLKSLSSFFFRC